MSTRVVATRYNDETLAQCLLLLQKHGTRIEGMPISRAVKTVLETIIRQQEKLGELKRMDNATATIFLENHNEPLEVETNPMGGFGEALKEITSQPPQEVVNLAETMRRASIPQVSKELEIEEGEIESSPTEQIWSVPFIPLADILEVAPDDEVVKKFTIEKGKGKGGKSVDLLQRCIEVVYKRVEPNLWGTPAVHKMVNTLFQDNL